MTMAAEPAVAASAREADLRIDGLLLRRLARCFLPFWRGSTARPYRFVMAAVLAQIGLVTALELRGSFSLKDATNHLVARDGHAFASAFAVYMAIFAAVRALPQVADIAVAWLAKAWRIWLTGHLTDRYLGHRVYYDIAQRGGIDNPDQRIQDSVASVVILFLGLPATVLGALSSFVAASAVLGSIDFGLAAAIGTVSVLQSVLTYLGYAPLVRLRYAAAMADGNLRYGLAHVGANAESIAFYGGEQTERVELKRRVASWVRRHLVLTLFQRLVTDLPSLLFAIVWIALPYIMLADRLFAGEIDYGTLTQAIAVAAMVSRSTQALLGVLAPFVGAAPNAVRIAQVLERADAVETRAIQEGTIATLTLRSDTVDLRDVSFATPDARQALTQHLDLRLATGENVVIVGETGVGKSSLLRVMAGLWRPTGGRLTMPPPEECLFLPQTPYVAPGSLRAQLQYPHSNVFPERELGAALAAVGLDHLPALHGGLDASRPWAQVLSLGELQRLAFARVILSKPRLVLLDEATSAVDDAFEAQLYRTLAETGARFVSVGHRLSIVRYHQFVLTLKAGGAWDWRQTENGDLDHVATSPRELNLPTETFVRRHE